MSIKLTKKQEQIVAKYEPTEIYGKAKGSFYANKKACAYEFCGGQSKYDEKLYNLGKEAFMEAYEHMLKGAKKPPKNTTRGSSKKNTKKTDLESRMDDLESKMDKILDLLSK